MSDVNSARQKNKHELSKPFKETKQNHMMFYKEFANANACTDDFY